MPRINPNRRTPRKAGGRPFKKGVSPNPGGRPKTPLAVRVIEIDVRRYARESGREAVDTLMEVMRGKLIVDVGTPEEPKPVIVPVGAATRLAAAEALLDRGYGRPPQAVEIAGKDGGPIITVSSAYDIICSRLDSIAARIEEGEGEAGSPRLTN
jgi:hypothetical protein